jgi:hypothetical protein
MIEKVENKPMRSDRGSNQRVDRVLQASGRHTTALGIGGGNHRTATKDTTLKREQHV